MDAHSAWIFTSALLTGGLAGATLTVISQWIRGRLLRPQLEMLFRNEEPGRRVDTNTTEEAEPVARFVRLKVKNSGRSTAFGVSVCVTKLTFEAPGAGSRIFAEDVLDLRLAYHAGANPFLLAPGAHRYIDLAHRSRRDLSHWYDLHPHPTRLRQQGFGIHAGTYGAEIFVAAENAQAVERFVRWSWDGAFPGLNIISNTAV
jgi:hypothetical protein